MDDDEEEEEEEEEEDMGGGGDGGASGKAGLCDHRDMARRHSEDMAARRSAREGRMLAGCFMNEKRVVVIGSRHDGVCV